MSVSEAAGGLGERADSRLSRPRGAGRARGLLAKLSDRTFVLMLGICVGGAIVHAFDTEGHPGAVAISRPTPVVTNTAPARAVQTVTAPAPTVAKAAVQSAADLAPVGPALEAAMAACVPEPTPQLLHTLAGGGPIRVGVFGDSFGDGVWAALYRRFPKAKGFQVLRFSQPSTGFTRYQQINLEDKAKAQLAAGAVDVAVINFGANDDQGLFDDDGHVAALLGANWKQIYADRAERFVGLMRAQGAAVFWMGLPRMRDPAYDQDMQGLSGTVSDRMARLGVPYVPVRDLSVDANGDYDDYLGGADGQGRLMRATDGVHMTTAGYGRLAEPVARQIERYIARGRAAMALPADAPHPADGCIVPASPAAPAFAAAPQPAPSGQP